MNDINLPCRFHSSLQNFVDCRRINWGSFPDWLAGLGAMLAFGLAVFLLWRWQAEQFRRERFKALAEQADQVAFWIDRASELDTNTNKWHHKANIRNDSSGIITDVKIIVKGVRGIGGGFSIDVNDLPPSPTEKPIKLQWPAKQPPTTLLEFRDARGEWWKRQDGRLEHQPARSSRQMRRLERKIRRSQIKLDQKRQQ